MDRFNQQSQESYKAFREVINLLDICILDSNYMSYRPRALVASAMYLVLALRAGHHTLENMSITSDSVLDESSEFTDLFLNFLYLGFGF